MDEAKKAMSKEAREVVERLEKERNEAMMEQREGRMGFFRVEKWWEDVKGEGSKARRKRLREEARKAGAGGDGEDGGVQLGTGFDSRIDEGDEMETEESKGWETDHDDMPSVLVLRPKRGES